MDRYVNISPFIASARLGGTWRGYRQVRLKAAIHLANSHTSLVLYGDGLRSSGKWERVPLTNIVLEDERGALDLAALLLAYVAARRDLKWDQLVKTAINTCEKAARIASWLRRKKQEVE